MNESPYEDIINLPHHVSAVRVPMSRQNRAAQFAPFVAVSGHSNALSKVDYEVNNPQDDSNTDDKNENASA